MHKQFEGIKQVQHRSGVWVGKVEITGGVTIMKEVCRITYKTSALAPNQKEIVGEMGAISDSYIYLIGDQMICNTPVDTLNMYHKARAAYERTN